MQRSYRGALAVAALLGLSSGLAHAQGQGAIITGRVTGEQGQPLPGANVYIQEMNISVGTNPAGQYTISVAAARVRGQSVALRVRSVGFTPDTRTISLTAGSQTVDFSLKTDVARLSEVVVTGVTAGTERIKVPFAVSRVDSSSMPVPGANPLSQLQGKVPGANIVSASGRPGQAPAVLLRGPRSINAAGRSQEPLYIVDGVILEGTIADIDPKDIESVEVVKGAAAASLYGSRAGAGVIQITTKTGKGAAEGVRFGFRQEYGVSDIEREIELAQRHALLMDETQTRFCITTSDCRSTIDWTSESMRINDNAKDFASSPPTFPIDLGSTLQGTMARRMFQSNPWPGNNYNAVEQFVKPQPLTSTNVDVSGRFGGTSFFASGGLLDQGGAVQFLKGYQRQSGRLNLTQLIGDHWNVQANTYFARATDDGSNQEGGGQAFFRLTRTPPIVDLEQRDSKGRLLVRPNLQGGGAQNENALYTLENVKREDVTNRFIGGVTVTYTPLEWLEASGNFSYDNSDQTYKQFQNRGFRTTGPNPSPNNNGLILNGSFGQRSMNSSLNLVARRTLLPELESRFNVRALYEQRDQNRRQFQGTGLSVSGVEDGRNTTQSSLTVQSPFQSSRQTGYAGGVNLEYKERYIVDALVRRDGSSLFGTDQRWKTYGRASLGWIASSEGWWDGLSDQLSLLKLSASYGTAGNSPAFAAQYETYTIGSGGTLTPSTLGNPLLQPEYVQEVELNAELELFNRVQLTATHARTTIDDQILLVPLPAVQGFENQWRNAGTLENRTWEFSVNVPVIQRAETNLSFRVITDFLSSKIAKLNVPSYLAGTDLQATGSMFRIAEGEQLGTFYGRQIVESCGQLPADFQGQCGPGRAFQQNSDGHIVWVGEGNTTADGITKNLWQNTLPKEMAPWGVQAAWGHPIVMRSEQGTALSLPLGQALPKQRLGFSSTFGWKKFSAYALVDAAFGHSIYNQARHWAHLDFLSRDQDQAGKSVADAKPASYYYRAGPPDNGAGLGGLYDLLGPTSHFVENADFAKLREVTLSYNIGPIGRIGNWTVGVVGRNLFTITDYKGFDPEVGYSGGSATANPQNLGSSALNAVDAFTFPNLRSVTFSIASTF